MLELEEGKTYRLHLASMDWLHGFSLQPENINIEVHPNYEHVITLTPTKAARIRSSARVLRHQPSHDGQPPVCREAEIRGRTMAVNGCSYLPRHGSRLPRSPPKN